MPKLGFSFVLPPSLGQMLLPLAVLLISALLSFSLSQFLFTRELLVWLYKLQNWLIQSTPLLDEVEGAKLQKMYSLWSPPGHPFPYLAHSLAVVLALRSMSTGDLPPTLWICLRNSLALALATTACTFGAQRVGEVNVLVLLLNLLHSSLLCTAIGLVERGIWPRKLGKEMKCE